jgi:hypothetical protein
VNLGFGLRALPIALWCFAASCRATRDPEPVTATASATKPTIDSSAADRVAPPPTAGARLPTPGEYADGLHVDVDADRGIVVLYMLQATGESTVGPGPHFVYSFYAMGKREPDRASIPLRAYWDFDASPRRRLGGEGKGELDVLGPDRIRVRLSFDPGGAMAVGPEIHENIGKDGAIFERDASPSEQARASGAPPIIARMVRAKRAVLRKEAHSTSAAVQTVLQDEVVYVQEQRKGGWLKVRFTSIDGTRSADGWLSERELEPLP